MRDDHRRALRFHQDVWDTPIRWNADGIRQRRTTMLESPYLPTPEITEREAGAALGECIFCRCVREDVGDMLVEFDNPRGGSDWAPVEVCASCRANAS